MITFICKKDIDYKKYGFVDEGSEWVVWNRIRKLTINKADMTLHFNCLALDDLQKFYTMIKDNLIVCKNMPRNKGRYHYLNLDDEEYKLIQEMRNKKYVDEFK